MTIIPSRTYRDVEIGLLRELRMEGGGKEAVVPPGVHLILNI